MKIKYPILLTAGLSFASGAAAQQATEAKIYQNYPIGLQMLQVGYGRQSTNSTFDGDITLPDKDVNVTANLTYLRYATFLKVFNKTAGIQAVLPYAWIDANILGVKANNSGLGDLMVVIGSSLIGAPAMRFAEFQRSQRVTTLAWSLSVTAPTGSYSTEKFLNPSSHRWQFKPELALSVPVNKLDFEGYVSGKLFTKNEALPGMIPGQPTSALTQKPFLAFTFHGIYNFNSQLWLSVDAASRFGGETSKNGAAQNNAQSVLGLGGTLTWSPGIHHKIGAGYLTNAAGNHNAPNGAVLSLKYSFIFGLK